MHTQHLTKLAEIILVVHLLSPIIPKYAEPKPLPEKRYAFDSTWRTRVMEYCAELVSVSINPDHIIPNKELIKLHGCVEKITKEN